MTPELWGAAATIAVLFFVGWGWSTDWRFRP